MSHSARLADFATSYAAAWSNHSATAVAEFDSERGSRKIDGGTPATGRAAVERAAQSFITAYPDSVVRFDRLEHRAGRAPLHWSFTGTNSEPGGPGNLVRISGW